MYQILADNLVVLGHNSDPRMIYLANVTYSYFLTPTAGAQDPGVVYYMSGLSFTVKADEAPVLEDPDEMDRSNYLEYISVEDLGAKVTQISKSVKIY
jgi:hypothetical protein